MKKSILFITALFCVISINSIDRKSLSEYAETLYGKKGAELKTAIFKLTAPSTVLDYGSGKGKTWEGFYTTDRIEETNECLDRYSNETWYFSTTSTNSSITGMNIEHSFPKSWWGGSSNSAYKDLYNLMPCEAKINSSKSNYGMGTVSNAKTDNGCTKVGSGSAGSQAATLWEPADKWKGDFARGYMYMSTAHQNLNSNYEGQALISLQKDAYPTLKEWAYTLYLTWSRNDKVTQLEVDRNNAVNAIQHNRNLFIDFPNLAEYVWGDSINVAFDPSTAITTCYDDDRYDSYNYAPGSSNDKPIENELFTTDFTKSKGDFSIDIVSSSLQKVWIQTSNYGMKASAFQNSTNYATEAWLVSPEIDLSSYIYCSMTFTEIINKYFKDVDAEATLWVKEGDIGTWTQISYAHPTLSGTWSSDEVVTIDLSAYDGKKIYIGFKYVSTTSAGTWEIKNISITGKKTSTDIPSVPLNINVTTVTYNLSGQAVSPSYKGVVIRNGRKYIQR